MEDTVLQRIRKIIDSKKISDKKFSEQIGIPQTTLSNLFIRGNEPNVTIVAAILRRYDDINSEWLVLGKGIMFKENFTESNFISGHNNQLNTGGSKSSLSINGENTALLKENEALREENKHLREENKQLGNEIKEEKERVIQLLMKGNN